MSSNTDKQNSIACTQQRDAVIAKITNRVHGMRSHLKHTVECKRLLDQKEEITPVYGNCIYKLLL